MEKIYDKLIRDNISDIIRSDGEEPITRILVGKEEKKKAFIDLMTNISKGLSSIRPIQAY